MAWPERLVLTCEHGGNQVPAAWGKIFRGHALLLRSPRGHDAGALELARDAARTLRAPLHYSTTTRLLVDLNRSLDHPQLFSELTRSLPESEKKHLLRRYWHPYRSAATARIRSFTSEGRVVLHVSVHSFAPGPDGPDEAAVLGLLYDPGRAGEAAFASRWQAALAARLPAVAVRRNQPHRGASDGFTSQLRAELPQDRYLGLSLEVSQAIVRGPAASWRDARRAICATLGELVQGAAPALLP